MDAILDSGWDEPEQSRNNGYTPSPLQQQYRSQPRPTYATNGTYEIGSFVPIDTPKTPGQAPNTGDSVSSSVDSRMGGNGHAKKRSGGRAMGGKDRYGPLGPLADDDAGWGGNVEKGRRKG